MPFDSCRLTRPNYLASRSFNQKRRKNWGLGEFNLSIHLAVDRLSLTASTILEFSGFGVVALHNYIPRLDQPDRIQQHAVKQVNWQTQKGANSPAMALWVHLEHQAMMRVQGCDNVVQMIEAWHDIPKKCSYIRMEYIDGFDLRKLGKKMSGRWTVELVGAVAAQVSPIIAARSIGCD